MKIALLMLMAILTFFEAIVSKLAQQQKVNWWVFYILCVSIIPIWPSLVRITTGNIIVISIYYSVISSLSYNGGLIFAGEKITIVGLIGIILSIVGIVLVTISK